MYEYIALSGGGIKGISYIGAFKALEKLKITQNIKGIIGSSVGSLLALFFVLGYTSDQMLEIITNIDLSKYTDDGLNSLLTNFGLDNGIKLINIIYAIAKQKYDLKNISFKLLYEKYPIELVITGSNITKSNTTYFSYKTTPDVLVLDAIRISISIPYKFTPIKYNNCFYVDGQVFSPYPIKYFKDKKVIGFILNTLSNLEPIENIVQYTLAMLISIEHKEILHIFKKFKNQTIQIKTDHNPLDLSVSIETKHEMFQLGYDTTLDFLTDHYYNNKLLKKVFSYLLSKNKKLLSKNKKL